VPADAGVRGRTLTRKRWSHAKPPSFRSAIPVGCERRRGRTMPGAATACAASAVRPCSAGREREKPRRPGGHTSSAGGLNRATFFVSLAGLGLGPSASYLRCYSRERWGRQEGLSLPPDTRRCNVGRHSPGPLGTEAHSENSRHSDARLNRCAWLQCSGTSRVNVWLPWFIGFSLFCGRFL
jgi:hypothetical protein